jgi:N,N'-diacetyllegionaminate synthase
MSANEHFRDLSRRCLIIGEVAQAHDGSLGTAHAYIDAVAAAGADAVKFQTHIAAAESSPSEPWRVKFSLQDATRFEYWKRMEFTEEQWKGLKEHANSRNLMFISSPFSMEAVNLLERVGVAAWKVASGEVGNVPMLARMISTGLPIMLSSGMSSIEELDQSVELIQRSSCELTLFQCSSIYPTPPEKLGLNLIEEMRSRYGTKVGLSDHSGTIYAGLAATTIGIDALEVHVAFSRETFGPDVVASVTTSELAQLVEGVRFIERARQSPVDKDDVAAELEGLRGMFTKSVAVLCDLPAGTVLAAAHLGPRKPGTGIPASRLRDLVGRSLSRSVSAGELLKDNDLEDE